MNRQDAKNAKKKVFLIVVSLGVLAVQWFLGLGAAWAADYPTRPIRLLVPFAAGGGADTLARIVTPADLPTKAEQGLEVATSTPQELAARIRTETKTWTEVIKSAGIRAE